MSSTMWMTQFAAFLSCHMAASLANKYVLSVLHFQFPTIFQCWQSVIGALVLKFLHAHNYVDLEFGKVTSWLTWLPCMIAYTCSIYCGSVSLSRLSVPAFLALQNVVQASTWLTEIWIVRQSIQHTYWALYIGILLSAFGVFLTDYEASLVSYGWMLIYMSTRIFWLLYHRCNKSVPQVNEATKMFVLYSFSAVALLPSTLILGDVPASHDFPFWYHYRFLTGCVVSGLMGPFLLITRMNIQSIFSESPFMSFFSPRGLVKIVTSAVLTLVLPAVVAWSHVCLICVNLILGVFLGSNPLYWTYTYEEQEPDAST